MTFLNAQQGNLRNRRRERGGMRSQKHWGRNGLAAAAPSFNCAVKFLRLPGPIWGWR